MSLVVPQLTGYSVHANPGDFRGGTSWEDIIHAINFRRTFSGRLINEMVVTRDIYNGDWIIPLADVKGEPDSRPAIPPLVNLAIDNPADRASSVMPELFCPAVNPGRPHGRGSRGYAETRRRALHSGWYESGLEEQVLPKAFRHFRAYGSMMLQVRPDFKRGRCRIETRDPLNAYPDLRFNELTEAPENVGFMTFRSRAWLKANYGSKQGHPMVDRALWNSNRDDSDVFEMVEWIDGDCYVIGVIGPRYYQNQSTAYPQWPIGGFELRRWQNKAGMVPVGMSHRVTLDRIMGAVNLLVPIINKMAKLDLLDYLSTEKSVFPDLVMQGKEGTPRLVSGAWQDGRTGEINTVVDGEVKFLGMTPGPMVQQRIDQLERSGRQASGNPAMFGGEATGNIRSGQTVSQLGSYSVDPDLQNMQRIMARTLQVICDGQMAVERGWFGARKIVSVSGFASDDKMVEYVPNDHYEPGCRAVVRYPFPGMDAESLTVAAGQLVGSGIASKETVRRIHPLIEQSAEEDRRIDIDRLKDAMLAGLVSQAQQPEMGGAQPVDLAEVIEQMEKGNELTGAVKAAHAAAQSRQASTAPPPQPGQLTAPQAQPGLSPPGVGAEQPQPNPLIGAQGMPADVGGQVGPNAPDMENLKQVFRALRAH